MQAIRISTVALVVILAIACGEASFPWNIFSPSSGENSTSSRLQEYARQKLSTLRSLRNRLNDQGKVNFVKNPSENAAVSESSNEITSTEKSELSWTNSNVEGPAKREIVIGNILKNVNIQSLRKMITTSEGIESLASFMMPKKAVLKRLLEIKGNLEPSLKHYLTDKYNGFLSSLIPYSENIGVPPFVLNSMKIPQDFDPRWQIIESLLETRGGVDQFLHNLVSGNFTGGKLPEVIESRTSDDTELISDQEPDANGQGYRKAPQQQQFYLSSFKKRVMKPSGGKVRLTKHNAVAKQQQLSSFDYDTLMDQAG